MGHYYPWAPQIIKNFGYHGFLGEKYVVVKV